MNPGIPAKAIVAAAGLALLSLPAAADYEDGVNAALSGDFETAFREFTIAAEEGLDLAQYNLGILYFTGQGVEQDYEAAFRWTEAAALQGHAAAQLNLGSLYYFGNGVPEDRDQAVEWYGNSAMGGNAAAAYTLAAMYRDGDHVDRDPVLAHAWAAWAVRFDHPEAGAMMEELENRMRPEQLSEARRTFARWQIQ